MKPRGSLFAAVLTSGGSTDGTVDSDRSQAIMDAMLTKIVETGATTCIFDIMGVVAVDTAVANHLIKITKTTRLMGCETIISGISPEVAQGMVNLGVELQDVLTATTVREALKRAK